MRASQNPSKVFQTEAPYGVVFALLFLGRPSVSALVSFCLALLLFMLLRLLVLAVIFLANLEL